MFGTLGHGLNHRFIKVLEASALPHCKQPMGLFTSGTPGFLREPGTLSARYLLLRAL